MVIKLKYLDIIGIKRYLLIDIIQYLIKVKYQLKQYMTIIMKTQYSYMNFQRK